MSSWGLLKIFLVGCVLVLFPLGMVHATEILIYTHDSIASNHGVGPLLVANFSKQVPACSVRLSSVGESGRLISRLQIDAQRTQGKAAVLVWGADRSQVRTHSDLFEAWPKEWRSDLSVLKKELIPADSEAAVPFDYGVYSFMVDTDALAAQGIEFEKLKNSFSLQDLLSERFKKKILLEDPRTSSPGLAFLTFTKAVLKNDAEFEAFWKRLKGQWLTLTPGWSSAYGLFLKQEASWVWSYTTSEAYHKLNGDGRGRYRAVLFTEGQPVQVETVALVRTRDQANKSEERNCARLWVKFLLSEESQLAIATKNYMLPVVQSQTLVKKLPLAYRQIPVPSKIIDGDNELLSASKTALLLKKWQTNLH